MKFVITCIILLFVSLPATAADKKVEELKTFTKVTVKSVKSVEFGFDDRKKVGIMDMVLSVDHVGCMGNWEDADVRANFQTQGNLTNVELIATADEYDGHCNGHLNRDFKLRIWAPINPTSTTAYVTMPQIFRSVESKLVLEYSLDGLVEPKIESYKLLNSRK